MLENSEGTCIWERLLLETLFAYFKLLLDLLISRKNLRETVLRNSPGIAFCDGESLFTITVTLNNLSSAEYKFEGKDGRGNAKNLRREVDSIFWSPFKIFQRNSPSWIKDSWNLSRLQSWLSYFGHSSRLRAWNLFIKVYIRKITWQSKSVMF